MTHTTRYGNTYTDYEWEQEQKAYAEEEELYRESEDRLQKMANYLRRQCQEFGFNEKQVNFIVNSFRDFSFEDQNVKFSSQKNQEFVNDLWARWCKTTDEMNIF